MIQIQQLTLLILVSGGSLLAGDAQLIPNPDQSFPASIEDTAKLVDQLVKDSKRLEIKRPSDPASPLRLAEEYAAWIAGDVKEFTEVMVKIILLHVQAGNEVDALYLAERLPGSGRLQSHAALALHLADEGKKEQSIQQQEEAERWLFQGSGVILQKALLNLLIAARLTEQQDRISSHKDKLTEINQVELDIAFIQRGLYQPQNSAEGQARMLALEARGVEELKARYMMATADAHLAKGNTTEGEKCFDEAGKWASSNGLAHEYRVMLDLAKLAHKYKLKERSEKCLSIYLQACDRFAMAAEWRAPYVIAAVELLLEWDRKDQALKWLKSARDGAGKVYIVDAAESHVSTARMVEKLDGPDTADAVVMSALRTGLLHPHPRVKGRAAVSACIYYHEMGRAVPEAVIKLLQKSREAPGIEQTPSKNGN